MSELSQSTSAWNELHRPVHRPLAILTYVEFNFEAEHAAAAITWVQARSEAICRDLPVMDGNFHYVACELCPLDVFVPRTCP